MTQEQLLEKYVRMMDHSSVKDSYGLLYNDAQYGTDHQLLYFVPYKRLDEYYEFPSFMYPRVPSIMDVSSVAFPVYIGHDEYSFSTLYKLLSTMNASTSRMLKVILGNSDIYYVNPNVILDSEFRILLLHTTSIIATHCEYNLYVHPDIFLGNNSGKLEKLLKKLIIKVAHDKRGSLCIKDVTSMFTLSAYTGRDSSSTREDNLYIEGKINHILISETSQLIKHMSIDDE